MDFSIFKIFTIFGIVSRWAARAFEDGKVTLVEAADLAFELCAILGIPTELDIPQPGTGEQETALSAEYREATGQEEDLTPEEKLKQRLAT